MPPSSNRFLGEKKSRLWHTGMPWAGDKVRVQDAVGIVFDTYKSLMEERGAFTISNLLKACLVRDVVSDDYCQLTQTLSFLFGYDLPVPHKIVVPAETKLEIITEIMRSNFAHVCTIVSCLFAFKVTDVPKTGKKGKKR